MVDVDIGGNVIRFGLPQDVVETMYTLNTGIHAPDLVKRFNAVLAAKRSLLGRFKDPSLRREIEIKIDLANIAGQHIGFFFDNFNQRFKDVSPTFEDEIPAIQIISRVATAASFLLESDSQGQDRALIINAVSDLLNSVGGWMPIQPREVMKNK